MRRLRLLCVIGLLLASCGENDQVLAPMKDPVVAYKEGAFVSCADKQKTFRPDVTTPEHARRADVVVLLDEKEARDVTEWSQMQQPDRDKHSKGFVLFVHSRDSISSLEFLYFVMQKNEHSEYCVDHGIRGTPFDDVLLRKYRK